MAANLYVAVLFLGCIPLSKSEAKITNRNGFLRLINEVFRMKSKDEHFSVKMKVLASLQLVKQLQKAPFCSGE